MRLAFVFVKLIDITILFIILLLALTPGRRPWELTCTCMPWRSIRCQLFPLNDFFSRTTRPISTNVVRKHA